MISYLVSALPPARGFPARPHQEGRAGQSVMPEARKLSLKDQILGVKICFVKSLYFTVLYGRWQNFRRRVAVKSADLA
jgi:hypothetical protein